MTVRKWIFLKIILFLNFNIINYTSCQKTPLDADKLRPFFRLLRTVTFDLFGHTAETPRLLMEARLQKKLQNVIPNSVPFPCDTSNARSVERPTSVHRLRPGDIDVIGALGDSLTAGNGLAATGLLQVITENRGLSWSIGGQSTWREFLTLPNILKEFNPKLVGYSYGDSMTIHKASQFNVAEVGAMSRDMPFMVRELARRMKNDPRVDYQNHWKLITYMIGPNDFCLDICHKRNYKSAPAYHRKNLIKVLRYIRDNIPRTFVNLVLTPDLAVLKNFTQYPECILNRIVECPCLYGQVNEPHAWKYLKVIHEWRKVEDEMPTLDEFRNNDNFTVVVQPFLKNMVFPTHKNGLTDNSYLSADCFHFSQRGDSLAANALWNNMLEPVGRKSTNWNPLLKPLLCPTQQHPYLFTNQNSQSVGRIDIR